MANRTAGAIAARLARLGGRTERMLLRFRLDGVGQRQIATGEGISVSAVEKHLREACRALLPVDAETDAASSGPRRLASEGMGDDRRP